MCLTLVARRAADGGWSHFQNPQISAETTCLGTLALAGGLNALELDSVDMLIRLQNPDGSWPAFGEDHPQYDKQRCLASIK